MRLLSPHEFIPSRGIRLFMRSKERDEVLKLCQIMSPFDSHQCNVTEVCIEERK